MPSRLPVVPDCPGTNHDVKSFAWASTDPASIWLIISPSPWYSIPVGSDVRMSFPATSPPSATSSYAPSANLEARNPLLGTCMYPAGGAGTTRMGVDGSVRMSPLVMMSDARCGAYASGERAPPLRNGPTLGWRCGIEKTPLKRRAALLRRVDEVVGDAVDLVGLRDPIVGDRAARRVRERGVREVAPVGDVAGVRRPVVLGDNVRRVDKRGDRRQRIGVGDPRRDAAGVVDRDVAERHLVRVGRRERRERRRRVVVALRRPGYLRADRAGGVDLDEDDAVLRRGDFVRGAEDEVVRRGFRVVGALDAVARRGRGLELRRGDAGDEE